MEGSESSVENCEEKKVDGIKFHEMDKMLQDCNRYINECEEVLQDCAKYFENVDETESIFSDEDTDVNCDGDKVNNVSISEDQKQEAGVENGPASQEECEAETCDGDKDKVGNLLQANDKQHDTPHVENCQVPQGDSASESKADTCSGDKEEGVICNGDKDKVGEDKQHDSSVENKGPVTHGDSASDCKADASHGDEVEVNNIMCNQEDENKSLDATTSVNEEIDTDPDKTNTADIIKNGDPESESTSQNVDLNAREKESSKKSDTNLGVGKEDTNKGQESNGENILEESSTFPSTDDIAHKSEKTPIDTNDGSKVETERKDFDENLHKDDIQKRAISDTELSTNDSVGENSQNVQSKNDPGDVSNKVENIPEVIDSTKPHTETKDAVDDDNVFISENSKTDEENENACIDAVKVKLDHLDSDDSIDDENQAVKLVPLRISEEFDSEIEKMKSGIQEYVDNKVSDYSISALEGDHKITPLEVNGEDTVNDTTADLNMKLGEIENLDDKDNNRVTDSNSGSASTPNQTENIVDYKMEGTQTMDVAYEQTAMADDKERRNIEAETLQRKMEELERELSTTKTALKSAHNTLANQQSNMNNTVITLKMQLYKTQTLLKQERAKSHQQLTDVISHLTFLEGNLRKGQIKHKRALKAKNEVIEIQKTEIIKLREQNEQLLNAIKEIYANGGMNGYMRDKHSHSEKKGHNGKLGMVKDKLLMKNRSSLELNNFNVEKFNLKNQRLCSSQEDLKNLHDDAFEENSPGHDRGSIFGKSRGSSTRGSKNGNKSHRKNLQNFFTEPETPKHEMNKSNSDSSQLSESSGVYSMSDQDCPRHTNTGMNGHGGHYDDDDLDYDEDDGRIFSFSSTHINTVIDEEEALGPVMSHAGHMMSMGSMPMLVPVKERQASNKDRPHSLSSVDLLSIQRQAANLSKLTPNETISESTTTSPTPPPSPSYNNNNNNSKPDTGKSEMTPFQTFKTMFKRKGSKNKGNKKRSVSLSQTTNMEYTEALKKHFQKFDMQ